jgi:hypothetical protein
LSALTIFPIVFSRCNFLKFWKPSVNIYRAWG